MARIARIVVPGIPHHITQRGARRMRVFLRDGDYESYLEHLREQTIRYRVMVPYYCLMPNHVHLIAVPSDPSGLARALGAAHHRYAQAVNRREGWRGHLWQERFWSFPMDEPHLAAAVRYVHSNPVRAGLVKRPQDWPYSTAAALLELGHADLVPEVPVPPEEARILRTHSRTGRPFGDPAFLLRLETLLGRRVRPLPRGPRPQKV